jgi:PhnB protein
MKTNPYISFNGQCEEALAFYAKCLGGTVGDINRYGGSPMDGQFPPEWAEKVMHARLSINGVVAIMGSDAMPGRYEAPKGITMSVSALDAEESERVFHALAEGGSVTMPIQPTFWSARFGMLVDRFGVAWMVNCEQPA